jgi:hypothetical protein
MHFTLFFEVTMYALFAVPALALLLMVGMWVRDAVRGE